MIHHFRRRSLISGCAAVALLYAHPVLAQSATAGAAAAGAQTGAVLEEVVVTARRTTERAQTVPVSVSVFNARALANEGIHTTTDLQRLVPGVILNGAGSDENTTYFIRGQGKAVIGAGLPSVINYINEVPLGSWGSVLPTYDVSNVQILKGPQGTLFGRNTTGGAVLVYSTPADFNYGGYFEAEVGNYNDHAFQGAVNLPVINDVLAVRAAIDVERRDGYTNSQSTGQKLDDVDNEGGRFTVLFTPTNWLTNTTVFDYLYNDNNGAGITASPPLNSLITGALQGLGLTPGQISGLVTSLDNHQQGIVASGPYNQGGVMGMANRDTIWGVSNTTKFDLPYNMTFKNLFGYRSTSINQTDDGSGLGLNSPLMSTNPQINGGLLAIGQGTAAQLIGLGFPAAVANGLFNPTGTGLLGTPGVAIQTANTIKTTQLSEEVQLGGTSFNNSLKWLVGAFYLDSEPGPDNLKLDVMRPTNPTVDAILGSPGSPLAVWPFSALSDNLYTDKSTAVFGNVSYDLSALSDFLKGFKANVGYRYTWDTEGVCANSRGVSVITGQPVVAPYTSLSQCKADPTSYVGQMSSSAGTYTLGLDYKVNDDVFLYFTTRKGYRAGGLNTPAMNGVLVPYQDYHPQTVTDYEVGAHTKWDVGGWKARFNIAGFTAKYTDLQLQATGIAPGAIVGTTSAPSNTTLTINAGTETVNGVELDAALAPTRALTLGVAASFLNPYYNSLNVPALLAPFFSSGPISGTPKQSYSANARYQLPVDENLGNIYFNVDYYYVSQEYQGYYLLPSYDLTNMNLQWDHVANKPVDLTFFVNNLFDKAYIHSVLLSTQTFGVYSGSYGPPRMYGVRLHYAF